MSETTSNITYDLPHLKGLVQAIPDFPQKGIIFQDIFPLFQDPVAIDSLILHLLAKIKASIPVGEKVDVIVGLDARGFLLGPSLAMHLGAAFVPVRKAGKLPGACISASYTKEYGVDSFEMQEGAIKAGQRVVIVDDLIATGGSAYAGGELVTKSGGVVDMYLFIIELSFLNGRKQLNGKVESLFQYDD